MRGWLEALLWWAVLVVVWLATLTSFSWAELITAAVLAAPVAVAVPRIRRAVGVRWRPRARWWRWLPSLAWGVLHDAVAVLRLRRAELDGGEFRRIPLEPGAGQERAATHEALATLALTATPGALVVGGDSDEGLLVHALPIGRTRLERVVRR